MNGGCLDDISGLNLLAWIRCEVDDLLREIGVLLAVLRTLPGLRLKRGYEVLVVSPVRRVGDALLPQIRQ
ncbi:MAG: hypothetical protein AAFO89_06500 [Planctomycetota bacterium]